MKRAWREQSDECTHKLSRPYKGTWRWLKKYGLWILGGIAVLGLAICFHVGMMHDGVGHRPLEAFAGTATPDNCSSACDTCQRFEVAGDFVRAIVWMPVVVVIVVAVVISWFVIVGGLICGGVSLILFVLRFIFWSGPIMLCTWYHLRKKQ